MFSHTQRGFLLIEGLLAAALTSLVVGAIAGVYLSTSQVHEQKIDDVHLLFLAHEGLEVARTIRDADSENFSTGTFGIATTTGSWAFSGSSDTYNGFTRSVTVASVDADLFKVTALVSSAVNSRTLSTYLSRWREAVVSAIGDWSNPDEEGSLDFSGGSNGIKIQVQGDYAYVIRSGGGTNFYVIDISDTSNPSIAGSTSLSSTLQNIAVSGNYAYVVSSSNSKEFIVVDVSTSSSPNEVGSYNLSGNQNARGVYAVGNTVYVVRDDSNNDELYIFNTTVPSAPVLLGGEDLNDDGNEVVVIGDYAYVATDGDELEVVDVSNSAAPNSVYVRNYPGGSNGISIAGEGSMVYVGRSNGDLEIMDVTTPTSPIWRSTYTGPDNDDINDIAIGNNGDYLFLASDDNDEEFQVVDVSDPLDAELIGDFDVGGALNGIAYSSSLDRAFGVGDSNTEFNILEPQ